MDVDNSLQIIEETHGLRRLTKVKPSLLARWVANCSFRKNKKSQSQDHKIWGCDRCRAYA